MLKDSLPNLPQTPGVYLFRKNNLPIYVGKAVNLKRRVASYFDFNLEPKTSKMVGEADSLDFIKVNSELESLLLEAKLIRKYQSRYNFIAKDDKHPLYIVITREEFPRVLSCRKLSAVSHKLAYGPFPSTSTIRSVLKMIRRIFPYSDHKVGKRPCLYSQIGLCNPCPSQIKNEELKIKYLKNIRNIKALLSGRIKSVQKNLEREMKNLSKDQKYEEAAKIREQIKKLDYITQPIIPGDSYLNNPNLTEDLRNLEIREFKSILKSHFSSLKSIRRIECYDISHLAGSMATASMVVFIDGEADKSQYKHFRIRQKKSQSDYDSVKEVFERRQNQNWEKPDLIIIDGGVSQINAFKTDIPKVGIAKNPDRLIIDSRKIRLQGPALNLVTRIRDEAHRFARAYHHKLVSKSFQNPDVSI